MASADTVPPAGTTWMGEWDAELDDRVYGGDPVAVGGVSALLTGIQHRSGSTVSGVALRVEGVRIPDRQGAAVTADLTPTQARELAEALAALAFQAERLDGIA